MKKKAAKSRSRKAAAAKLTVVPTLSSNMTLQVRGGVKPASLKRRETKRALLNQVAKALSKQGLSHGALFTHAGVISYSVSPSNPALLVRERADGKKQTGRLVNGQFRAASLK